MSLFRLCYMLAHYAHSRARTALVARRRPRPWSMTCACGNPACVWLAHHPAWGRREFCGDCFTRRRRRREVVGRAVLVAIGVGAIAALTMGRRAP